MAAFELRNKKPRTAPPRTNPPARTQPWLERLPVELVEQVFFHALELNMPQASPFLCKTLSKESIYKTLILLAFFEDDEKYPVEKKHFAAGSYRTLSFAEKLRLQKGVLESRWCSVSRIRQCLPILQRLAGVQQWHRDHDEGLGKAVAPEKQDVTRQQRQLPSSIPPLDNMPAVLASYTTDCIPSDRDFSSDNPFIHRGAFNVYKLPTRLLNPASWLNTINSTKNDNSDPVKFLTLLWNAYSNTNRACAPSPADPAVLFLGIETAIKERHREALDLLMQIYGQTLAKESEFGDEISLPINPIRLIHLATRQGADSEWMLKLLHRQLLEEVLCPRDDPVLIKWALEKEDVSEFARDLLEDQYRVTG